jgi:hypothetical protein
MCSDLDLLASVNPIADDDDRSRLITNLQLVSPRKDIIRLIVIYDALYSSTGDHVGRLFQENHAAGFMDRSLNAACSMSSLLRCAWLELFRCYVEEGDSK